jgi:RNA polymerase sigma factor (sigma-70 family)
MSEPAAKVYLVDDDRSVRTAIGRLIASAGYDYECYASAEEFLGHFDPAAPGCVVLDLALPGMDGFAIQSRLSSIAGDRAIIFLTGRGDIPASVRAMKAGAVDFLTKPIEADIFLAAIESAVERDWQSRSAISMRISVEQSIASLTPRERQILDRIVEGRLNKQIAYDLGITEKTVKVHRSRIMRKIGARTVADLVRRVVEVRS